MKGWQAEDVPFGAFLRPTTAMFWAGGISWCFHQSGCGALGASGSQHRIIEMVWGQGTAQTSGEGEAQPSAGQGNLEQGWDFAGN